MIRAISIVAVGALAVLAFVKLGHTPTAAASESAPYVRPLVLTTDQAAVFKECAAFWERLAAEKMTPTQRLEWRSKVIDRMRRALRPDQYVPFDHQVEKGLLLPITSPDSMCDRGRCASPRESASGSA